MPKLVRFFSFNSYYFLSNAVGVVLAIAVLSDGLTTLDVLIVAAYVVLAGLTARRLRAPAARLAHFDNLAAFDLALRDPRPTMLEFYSHLCAACLFKQPAMARFEREVSPRLQILRINVAEPVGLQLADRYGVSVTPCYLLLNGAGHKDEAFTFSLNRPRVLYWLDQQTLSAPLPGTSRF